jgi:hypothetical protein
MKIGGHEDSWVKTKLGFKSSSFMWIFCDSPHAHQKFDD